MESNTQPDAWTADLARLQAKYPKASEGILFCVSKLEQDPEASMRDFRDEAHLRRLKLSGRSLHSAKVLLGMEQPSVRKPKADKAPARPAAPRGRPRTQRAPADAVEGALLDAVRQIQSEASAESQRLRGAIQEAIAVLQRALNNL